MALVVGTQKLIILSQIHNLLTLKISSKTIHNFLRYLADMQTNIKTLSTALSLPLFGIKNNDNKQGHRFP